MSDAGFYQTTSAVLFIVFNRPDTTRRVFEEIKKARPSKLYISADGPRANKPGEDLLCDETRTIVNNIDWPCQVSTLFNDHNKGCKDAVSNAISWFFDHEEEGIILEDDCLPHNSFFRFCDDLLARYRNDIRVRHISGCNFQYGIKRGAGSYYFSNLSHVWGWAGWRRVWKDYDKELSQYTEIDAAHYISQVFTEPLIAESWLKIFKDLKAGLIDTWDYQLAFLNFFNNGLSVIPNQNMISNIGFGANATHTVAVSAPNANIPALAIEKVLQHPLYILPEKDADTFTLNADFDIVQRKRKQNSLKYKAKQLFRKK